MENNGCGALLTVGAICAALGAAVYMESSGYGIWAQISAFAVAFTAAPPAIALAFIVLCFVFGPFILGLGYLLDWASKPGWRHFVDEEFKR